ncbi:MAG TPA: class I SAM-dependent methyltransferase [Clostridia bacterium]|jgi:ubiquinone/menaquinone biosynthesis C-methylase UbiE|nr:class I SAM-dependent methyltransferase [Clostridia bacterium]
MKPFDSSAKSYDSWYESRMGAFVDRVETELAFSLFPHEKGMKVLDVGCGTGNQSIKLARKGVLVTGIDISTKMLEIAKEKARDEGLSVNFRFMDAEKLEFEDEFFDGAISITAFEFLPKPEKVLKEMFRVVKKGGSIVVGTINRDSSWGEMYMSEKYRQDSVFKYADLKSLEDMKKWYPEKLVTIRQSLFIPPNAPEEEITPEREKELSERTKGGFICALWKK